MYAFTKGARIEKTNFVFFTRYYYLNDKVKEYEIAGTCSMCGERRMLKNSIGEMKGKDNLGDPDMEG